ncbi:unnamed protein product [Mycena citricolor]|uniref:BTB domain-containing protein n=1 Tax=Mycena citricolor TaxID=2018698 RepID=A0AAD2HPR5_9AGAR|nr:unnamed protein product [Mycena citricolor]
MYSSWDDSEMFGSPQFLFDSENSPLSGYLPSPPPSNEPTPRLEELDFEPSSVLISTTFFPDAVYPASSKVMGQQPDVVLVTPDKVHFYVHSCLLDLSCHRLSGRVPWSTGPGASPVTVEVPDTSPALNVILHSIYGMSCEQYTPTFEVLVEAADAMLGYGLDPKTTIIPSTPLFSLILSQAPLFPLELYILAARYDMIDLATPTSSHLLGYPLSRLTDVDAEQMGSIYLKRLFFMHNGRIEALRRLLVSPPHPHAPTGTCDFSDQKGLNRAWALARLHRVGH